MRDGVKSKKKRAIKNIKTKPKINPSRGEIIIAARTLKMPVNLKEEIPAFAKAAPSKPPINACDELEGNPKYQVKIFQKMAPIKAARIISTLTIDGSIKPVPMVFATLKPKNKNAIKLKNAAQMTAQCGFKTRVETMVAIEFAAS